MPLFQGLTIRIVSLLKTGRANPADGIAEVGFGLLHFFLGGQDLRFVFLGAEVRAGQGRARKFRAQD